MIIGSAALAAVAACTAACHPVRQALHIDTGRPISVVSPLDCPNAEGDLIRVSASADGRSCVYRSNQGEDVTLSLLPLAGQSPQKAVTPLETQLRTLAPHGDSDEGTDEESDGDNAKTSNDGHEHAKVDLPFVHVDTDDDKAHVKVFGVTIDADNDNANVRTNWGSKTAMIKAGPQGAEIRAVDTRHGAADLMFILAGDQPGPTGYHSVGYVARGPSGGPLVVATFKSKANHRHEFHKHEVDELVRRNLRM